MTLSGYYRRPLVATDHNDARSIRHLLSWIDPSASIILLQTYRIPFGNLRAIAGAPRLERELRSLSLKRGLAWIAASGLDPSRFQIHMARGEIFDSAVREARSIAADIVILDLRRGCRAFAFPKLGCAVMLRRRDLARHAD